MHSTVHCDKNCTPRQPSFHTASQPSSASALPHNAPTTDNTNTRNHRPVGGISQPMTTTAAPAVHSCLRHVVSPHHCTAVTPPMASRLQPASTTTTAAMVPFTRSHSQNATPRQLQPPRTDVLPRFATDASASSRYHRSLEGPTMVCTTVCAHVLKSSSSVPSTRRSVICGSFTFSRKPDDMAPTDSPGSVSVPYQMVHCPRRPSSARLLAASRADAVWCYC